MAEESEAAAVVQHDAGCRIRHLKINLSLDSMCCWLNQFCWPSHVLVLSCAKMTCSSWCVEHCILQLPAQLLLIPPAVTMPQAIRLHSCA
jgi:hypothetical protein